MTNKSSIFSLSVLAAPLALAGPRWGQRTCPDFEPVADLDLSRYAGTWYENVRDRATPFELMASCVVADYTLSEDGSQLGVVNSGYRQGKGWNIAQGTGVPVGDGIKVSFEGMPDLGNKPNYFVLDTDYDNYAIVYSCDDYLGGLFTFDLLWILTRDTSINDAQLGQITSTIERKVPSYDF